MDKARLTPFSAIPAEADHSEYASPQQLVDIGGRKLHLHCQDNGDTTVIFSSGSGRPGSDWALVQPEIAKRHPKEVAALALLDAQHEDEAPRLDKLTNGAYSNRTRQL